MRRLFVFSIIALILVAAVGVSLDYATEREVLSSGGTSAASADYALDATLGQAMIGLATSADYALCSGFWCGDFDIAAGAGKAAVAYSWTFGQIGMVAVALVLLAVVVARWLYNTTRQLWNVRRV